MSELVQMNWKLSEPWTTAQRGQDFTVTARLINMDSADEITITLTQPSAGPVHDTVGSLRAFAALIEQHAGIPLSDPMAFPVRRLS